MAYDLSTAKQMAAQLGVQPPAGADYDTWVMQWFEAGINSGDPRLVKAAGGTAAEEAEGGITPWQDAADPSEWMGKRAPTPRELRKWAITTGRSEDYERFDDRQLAQWLKKWDVAQNGFVNDFGDVVDKPTESGVKSTAAGYATGEKNAGMAGGGGGGGKEAVPEDTTNIGTPGQLKSTGNALQDALIGMFNSGGGIMGEGSNLGAVSLKNGGLMWGSNLIDALKDNTNESGQVLGGGTITTPQPGGVALKPAAQGGIQSDAASKLPANDQWTTGRPVNAGLGTQPSSAPANVSPTQPLPGVDANPLTGTLAGQQTGLQTQPSTNPLMNVIKKQYSTPTPPPGSGGRWWA